MKKILLLFILSAVSIFCIAQSSVQYGIIPSINIIKKFPKNWSANFKAESRQSIYNQELKNDYLLTDLSLVVTKRIAANTTVGGGYLLRAKMVNLKIEQFSKLVLAKSILAFEWLTG